LFCGWKLAVAVNLGLDGLGAVDCPGQFRTAEGDDGEPAEDDEGDEEFHVRGWRGVRRYGDW